MEYLGASLKDAREKRGISLSQVHNVTKIPKDILENIEADRISTINPAYLKGYIKIYSKYLKLDVSSVIEAYKDSLPQKENINLTADLPDKKTRLIAFPFKFDLRACLKIIIPLVLVFFLFNFIKFIVSRKKIKTPVANTTAGDLKKNINDTSALKQETSPDKSVKNIKIAKSGDIQLAMQVKDKTYVQVKVDGKPVFKGSLRKGQTENWTAKEKIELSIGSAGSVDLEVNGRLLPSLGRKNQPIKNMIISRDGSIQIK